MKTTQETINQKVWRACDTFRGTIDPSQYKDYILTTLFIKYLSDVDKENTDKLMEKYNGDVKRVERGKRYGSFQVPEVSSFDYLYDNKDKGDIGNLINIGLNELEEANRGKLDGVFRNIDFNSEPNLGPTKERNRRLINLLNDFADLDLRPASLASNDVIGDAYEYLIAHFASDAGKKAGEFYTPAEVSTLLAKLVEPQAGNRICDPTCGSGSLLLKVAKETRSPSKAKSDNFSLYGQENNGATYALAKMNIFLHKMDSARIEWGDTLNNPKLTEGDGLMKFDIVVANPPFSLDKWGVENAPSDRYNRFHRGIPPKSKGDYAFITHMIETLNEHGRAGIVLPHGVLFRGGAEGKIRKQFIEENLLKAVIGLPANLFFGTSIPASILIFDKNKGDNTDVLFIDASREYADGKNQNKLREEDITKIYDTYRGWKSVDKYAYVASVEEIRENEYNLNIPRYVDTFEEEEPVDIAETQREIETIKATMATLEAKMADYLKALGV